MSNFQKVKIDTTLLTQILDSNLFIVKNYVDDIIFSSANSSLCENFANFIIGQFKISFIGELTFLF